VKSEFELHAMLLVALRARGLDAEAQHRLRRGIADLAILHRGEPRLLIEVKRDGFAPGRRQRLIYESTGIPWLLMNRAEIGRAADEIETAFRNWIQGSSRRPIDFYRANWDQIRSCTLGIMTLAHRRGTVPLVVKTLFRLQAGRLPALLRWAVAWRAYPWIIDTTLRERRELTGAEIVDTLNLCAIVEFQESLPALQHTRF